MSQPAFKAYFIPDKQSGGYTAFVDEIPAAVSQGATLDEAKDNLMYALHELLRFQNQDEDEDDEPAFWKRVHSQDVIVQDLNIAL
jgi:predicted RNase H-like HicB family nuclease